MIHSRKSAEFKPGLNYDPPRYDIMEYKHHRRRDWLSNFGGDRSGPHGGPYGRRHVVLLAASLAGVSIVGG